MRGLTIASPSRRSVRNRPKPSFSPIERSRRTLHTSAQFYGVLLAGAPGFEPGNGGIKIRCLTTWLRPSGKRRDLTGKATGPQPNALPPSKAILARRDHYLWWPPRTDRTDGFGHTRTIAVDARRSGRQVAPAAHRRTAIGQR